MTWFFIDYNIEQHLQCCVPGLTINEMLTVEVVNNCVTLFFGYQTSDCLRPCKRVETKSKLVSRMNMNKPDEMRIRIKLNPTVTVTTTDFVKPSLGVFMSEVRRCTEVNCLNLKEAAFNYWEFRLAGQWDSGWVLVLFRFGLFIFLYFWH